MMTPKQERQTRQIEMVETHNLALSIARIKNVPGYDSMRWRRALYHAIGMTGCASNSMLEKIRQAMELP